MIVIWYILGQFCISAERRVFTCCYFQQVLG
jgi:hypothetical protein